MVPTPNVAAFQLGKEYGNNGQCNPTYFTVGNLVQYLQTLEKQGISRQNILDNYVFFTAAPAAPAALECTKRSIASHSRTPDSTAFASVVPAE